MSIKERKEREKEEMRKIILETTSEIICEEGLENLSIRKIAKKIEYSPTIIYHYFKDKDDIVMQFMSEKYLEIIKNIVNKKYNETNLIRKLKSMIYNYIKIALENEDIYKVIMISSDKKILDYTSVLFEGSTNDRELMNTFRKLIEQIVKENNLDESNIEMKMQVIWTSIFGLILRLIIEKNINNDQKENLIKNHIEIIINSVLLNKKLENIE